MECAFRKLIYPAIPPASYDGCYGVAIYTPRGKLLDPQGSPVHEVKVVGHGLPVASGLHFDLKGHWGKTPKYGFQFEMQTYEDVIVPGREGVVAYLSSGLLKGIGAKIAERIYDTFGDRSLEVLDKNPDELLKVPGISCVKLTRIVNSYLATRGARDVVTILAPHGITGNRAVRIFKEYGQQTIEILRTRPYQLCEMAGIGFKTADSIAKSLGLHPLSPERISAGLIQTLKDAETCGHLCLEKSVLLQNCTKLLNTDGLTERMVACEANALLKDGKLCLHGQFAYRASVAQTEQAVATRVQELLLHGESRYKVDLQEEIGKRKQLWSITLDSHQQTAVISSLTHPISIITGGPGTGKTLIQRVILDIYQKERPNCKIVCCAPTGRAARRMEQCTGIPASTIHKALGLLADEGGAFNDPTQLDADLVLVDEASMLDIYLARHLLRAIPHGCQLILVGDADQLPSVGPGAVLSELIACGKISVVKLDKVYRQNAGSRVAINASLIRHGETKLHSGEDFVLIESDGFAPSAAIIEQQYLAEVARCGIDNVALLTPYRKKSETGVVALNERLRNLINPSSAGKPETKYGKRLFRMGDKVMQIKNRNDINNGDIGYITKIINADGDTTVFVDFGDGRTAEYDTTELDLLELAYASTVHKSQGSEYQSVIINLQTGHYLMLKRPLVYTAITRAKKRVCIVGERKAISIAIRTVDVEKRGTQLAARINS